jgi:hypothetical protein
MVDVVHHVEELSLDRATTHILEECRMVLSGIQALFGDAERFHVANCSQTMSAVW